MFVPYLLLLVSKDYVHFSCENFAIKFQEKIRQNFHTKKTTYTLTTYCFLSTSTSCVPFLANKINPYSKSKFLRFLIGPKVLINSFISIFVHFRYSKSWQRCYQVKKSFGKVGRQGSSAGFWGKIFDFFFKFHSFYISTGSWHIL